MRCDAVVGVTPCSAHASSVFSRILPVGIPVVCVMYTDNRSPKPHTSNPEQTESVINTPESVVNATPKPYTLNPEP